MPLVDRFYLYLIKNKGTSCITDSKLQMRRRDTFKIDEMKYPFINFLKLKQLPHSFTVEDPNTPIIISRGYTYSLYSKPINNIRRIQWITSVTNLP